MSYEVVFAEVFLIFAILCSTIFIGITIARGRLSRLRIGFICFYFITFFIAFCHLFFITLDNVESALSLFSVYSFFSPFFGGLFQSIALWTFLQKWKHKTKIAYIPIIPLVIALIFGIIRATVASASDLILTNDGIQIENSPLSSIYSPVLASLNVTVLVLLLYGWFSGAGAIRVQSRVLAIVYLFGSILAAVAIFSTSYYVILLLRYLSTALFAILFVYFDYRYFSLNVDDIRFRTIFNLTTLPILFSSPDYKTHSTNSYFKWFLQSWPKGNMSITQLVKEIEKVFPTDSLPESAAVKYCVIKPAPPLGMRELLILITPLKEIDEYSFIIFDLAVKSEEYQRQLDIINNYIHDLRHPINIILGYIDLLSDRQSEKTDPLSIKAIEAIGSSAMKAEALLTDFLKTSIGKHVSSPELDEFNPFKESVKIGQTFIPIFSSKNQILDLNINELEKETKINHNYLDFYRIISNLLSNAYKHNPVETKIELGAKVENDFFILWVKDWGRGIDKSKIPHIFDRKLESELEKDKIEESRSSGYGLHSVFSLTKRNLGQVYYESNPEGGSIFTVEFRL